jgi:hypothetical protein
MLQHQIGQNLAGQIGFLVTKHVPKSKLFASGFAYRL